MIERLAFAVRGGPLWNPLVAMLRRISANAALVCALVILTLAFFTGASEPIDNLLSESRARLLTRPPSGDLVVVEIDAQSLRDAQEWPWPRSYFARAVSNLHAAGANLIGFDVDFSARSTADDDTSLSDAIESDPGSVVLPTFLQRSGEANIPLASLAHDAVLASVNVEVDRDGRARRYNRGFRFGGRYYGSMAAVLAGAGYGSSDQFLIDYGIDAQRIDRLSFADVMRNRFDPARVRGKTILIGASALELGDKFATPIHPAIPGVYVHALAFESLIQGRALMEPRAEFKFILALLVLWLLWPSRQPRRLKALVLRHVAMLALVMSAPILIELVSPVSIDVGLLLMAQTICLAVGVRRELNHRAAQLAAQREAHLHDIAHHDPETALPNRRALLDTLSQSTTHAGPGLVVLAAVGVDRFSVLRGAVGYVNANKIVAQLAARLARFPEVRGVYLVSTSILGVFAVVANEDAARRLAERCANPESRDFAVDGIETELSLRVGVATASPESAAAEKLLETASVALDRARVQKRRIAYPDATSVDPRIQLAILSDVRRGLERGDFNVLYQPKVSAGNGAVVGAEALLRWLHPVHGVIAPDVFIAAAEDTGAIGELTHWMLRRVMDDQSAMIAAGLQLPLSVNLSARSLVDPEFCREALSLFGDRSGTLCLEITETAVIEDPSAAIAGIEAFKAAGVRISIDDYGAGLSSLSYLKQIAADEVKLDRSLVRELSTSQRDRLILKSTIDLAHGLGMSVCAEGVEGEAERAIVAAMGCDTLQGFYVSKPLALGAFIGFCARSLEPAALQVATSSR